MFTIKITRMLAAHGFCGAFQYEANARGSDSSKAVAALLRLCKKLLKRGNRNGTRWRGCTLRDSGITGGPKYVLYLIAAP